MIVPGGEAAGRHTVLDLGMDGYLAMVEWTGAGITCGQTRRLARGEAAIA